MGVITLPTPSLNIDTELSLVKSAILFAGHVRVYSPTCALIQHVASLRGMSDSDFLDFVSEFGTRRNDLELAEALEPMQTMLGMPAPHRLTAQGKSRYKTYRKLRDQFQEFKERFVHRLNGVILTPSYQELVIAENEGLLSFVKPDLSQVPAEDLILDFIDRAEFRGQMQDASERMHELTDVLVEMFRQGVLRAEYPLLDSRGRSFVSQAIGGGEMKPTKVKEIQAGIAGLGSSLMFRLDVQNVPMDEVLDVRREISKHTMRFHGSLRSAIQEMNALQWDRDFDLEAQLIFETRVAPAVAELQTMFSDNLAILKAVGVGSLVGTSITITLAAVEVFAPWLAAVLGIGGAAAVAIAQIIAKQFELNSPSKGSGWHFYFSAEKAFSSRQT